MLDLAVGGYTKEEILHQLHLGAGAREVSFRYELVNKDDLYLGELPRVTGRLSFHSTAEIKRTASLSITTLKEIDLSNERIVPYFRLKMPGGFVEWPLGILLLSSPTIKEYTSSKVNQEIDAFDKCQILKEDGFTKRHTLLAGAVYTQEIARIIATAGIGKVKIAPSTATLAAAIDFELGTSKLEAVNGLLSAINYTSLYFDELGYATAKPYIEPQLRDVEYEYRTDSLGVIHQGASQALDLFGAPNVFIRTVSTPDRTELTSVYTNDNPSHPLSTVNRGRSIVDFQTVTDIADQATLDAYTRRQAINASQIYRETQFDTSLMPHHSLLDCLYLEHTNLGVQDVFIEQSWEMELKAGGSMRHTARKVVDL